MSDPQLTMPNSRDESAPLPWLGKTGVVTRVQTWSANGQWDSILLFLDGDRLTVSDHFPCVRMAYHRVVVSLLPILVFGSLLALTNGVFRATPIPWHTPLLRGLAFIISAVGSAMILFYLWLAAPFLRRMFGWWTRNQTAPDAPLPVQWFVSSVGIENANGASRLFWHRMKKPKQRHGNLYFTPRWSWWNIGVYIPLVAFADKESAGRFHTACVALWETGGNVAVLPEEVRAEFAPIVAP